MSVMAAPRKPVEQQDEGRSTRRKRARVVVDADHAAVLEQLRHNGPVQTHNQPANEFEREVCSG